RTRGAIGFQEKRGTERRIGHRVEEFSDLVIVAAAVGSTCAIQERLDTVKNAWRCTELLVDVAHITRKQGAWIERIRQHRCRQVRNYLAASVGRTCDRKSFVTGVEHDWVGG